MNGRQAESDTLSQKVQLYVLSCAGAVIFVSDHLANMLNQML